jgi:hypothetical protein
MLLGPLAAASAKKMPGLDGPRAVQNLTLERERSPRRGAALIA